MSKFTLIETPIDFGLTPDYTFLIYKDEEEIGQGGYSDNFDGEDSFLEWIELYPKFQNQSLFRPVLLALFEHFSIDTLVFDSAADKVNKYLHLGAEKTTYDNFREMQRMVLHIDALKKEV